MICKIGNLGRLKVGLLVGALALAGCDTPEERVEEHFQRGVALVADEQDVKAVLEFRNALRIDENHAGSRFEIAKLYERGGNFQGAVANYRLATELDPENVEALRRLAMILIGGGALDEASVHIEQALSRAPNDPDVLATKAGLEFRLGDTDAAIEHARAALETAPDNLVANTILINERAEAGDYAAALERLDVQLAARPDDPALNILKLRVLAASGDRPGIEAHLMAMIERFPDTLDYRRALAQMLAEDGDVDGAEAQLEAIATLDEENPTRAVFDLVRFIRAARGADAARAELMARIESGGSLSDTVDLRLALSEMEYAEGDRNAAQSLLQTIIDSDADPEATDRARVQLARMALAGGDRARAKALVDAVLARDEVNLDAIAIRATMLIDDYKADEAIGELRRGLNDAPGNVQLLMLEARAHERNGSPSLAGGSLASATRSADFAPDVAGVYARFLIGQDQASSAEVVLSESARRNPANRELLLSLAQLRIRLGDNVGAQEIAEQLRRIDSGGVAADQLDAALRSAEGDIEGSINILERLAHDPETRESALAGLVGSYVRSGQTEEAIAFLDEVIADNPRNLRALIIRAELALTQGDDAGAETFLKRAVEADPAQAAPHLALIRFHTMRGEQDAAMEVARTALDSVNANASIRLLYAQLLEGGRQFERAIAEYQTLYDADPNSIIVANNLASLLAEFNEDDAEKLELARRISQRLRGSRVPHFQDTYGWIQYLTGDSEGALRSLAPAAEALPTNPLVRYHIGRVYADLGQTEQARTHLEAALELDGNFPKARSAREALEALGGG